MRESRLGSLRQECILITIDYQSFTPLMSLVGGCMIGMAAVMLFLGSRRIAGISGIFGEVLTGLATEGRSWRLFFIVGMLLAPWLVAGFDVERPRFELPWGGLLLAGFVTGYGTRIARGCTSGHGVCGLSRLSLRSFVAVLSFMMSGMVTVAIIRIVGGE